MEFDSQKLGRWIGEVIVQKRELAHLDFKCQATSASLLKDLVALYNTSDSPFEGLGLIVIGVTDTHEVMGLSEAELRSFPTASSREDSLVQLLRDNVTPPPELRVLELELDQSPGLRLHVVVVPESTGAWSMVHASRAEQGHWIRHGAHSVRPKPLDYEKYLQRLVFSTTDALQQQLTGLQAAADEQRLQLTNLVVSHMPAEVTNAQRLRTAFRFPERTLVQTVRSEVNQYLAASGRLDHSAVSQIGLDRQDTESEPWEDHRQALKHSLEQLEEITRPLVELLGILAHDVPLPQPHTEMMGAVEMALADIENAALATGPPTLRSFIIPDAGGSPRHGRCPATRHERPVCGAGS